MSLPVIFRDDFNTIDLSKWELFESPSGVVTIADGGLRILNNVFWNGSIYRLARNINAYPLEIEFTFRGWGPDSNLADGFTCFFYKDDSSDIGSYLGEGIGFGRSDQGYGEGYCIEFDSHRNAIDPISGPHIALMKNHSANHIKYTGYGWNNGVWAICLISIYPEDGQDRIKVSINGNEVLSWLGVLDKTYGRLGFSAATGDGRMYVCLGYVEIRGIGLGGIYSKVNGKWRRSTAYVKAGGSWRPVEAGWIKEGGVWKPLTN